jgi:quinol monooxygenase YgiN
MDRMRAAMRAVVPANRKEDGCIQFAFGEDVMEPGVIRIVEHWRDWDALAAHGRAPHMTPWRAALKEIGVSGRDVTAYEASNPRPI